MSGLSCIDDVIDRKLLDLHTAYIAKVLSVSGSTAKIQPLGMTKQTGEKAVSKSPISGVPIVKSAQKKITDKSITYVSSVTFDITNTDGYVSSISPNINTQTETISVLKPIAAGDIVVCVCCDRNITEAKKGNNGVVPVGHHSLSDSVIVGVL